MYECAPERSYGMEIKLLKRTRTETDVYFPDEGFGVYSFFFPPY